MGLAAPKRRSKISADPNNTAWSSRTDSFGQKILRSQGWTPGSYLGAEDASHKAHYTAANASHIRVLLKEDNLGLGASKKREGAETFGLDQFSGLLGRLNGKSEEVLVKEEGARRDVNLRLWADRKGGVKFVSAGFLVGDKVEKLRREEVERKEREEAAKDVRGKKRKADGKVKQEMAETQDVDVEDNSTEDVQVIEQVAEDDEKAAKRRRKEERRQHKADKEQRREAKRTRKAEKEEKRRRKEERKKAKAKGNAEGSDSASSSSSEPMVLVKEPAGSMEGPPQTRTIAIPRRMVRQRYIQQKRMAGLDSKALNEVWKDSASHYIQN